MLKGINKTIFDGIEGKISPFFWIEPPFYENEEKAYNELKKFFQIPYDKYEKRQICR